MGISVRHLSAWHPIQNLWARHMSEWRRIRRLRVRVGGAWREVGNFILPLTASASGTNGIVYANGAATVTGSVSATPGGGLGPYSYAWTLLSWTGGGTLNFSSSRATTSVWVNYPAGIHNGDATLRCVITDARGGTASATAIVNLAKETFD